jgi:hypothetical protein
MEPKRLRHSPGKRKGSITTYCVRFSKEKVWIKVCKVQSEKSVLTAVIMLRIVPLGDAHNNIFTKLVEDICSDLC